MVSVNFLLLLLMIPPLMLMAFLLDRSARKILLFLLLGMFTAFLSGQINTLLINGTDISSFDASIHYIPVIEEFLKAFPVVAYIFVLRPKRREIAEYAVAVGLGFAFFENVWAFTQSIYGVPNWEDISFVLSRGLGASMVHSLCTVILVYGSYIFMKWRKLLFTGTFALFSLVCLFHSLFNVLIGSERSILAFVLTLGTYVIVLVLFKRGGKLSE